MIAEHTCDLLLCLHTRDNSQRGLGYVMRPVSRWFFVGVRKTHLVSTCPWCLRYTNSIVVMALADFDCAENLKLNYLLSSGSVLCLTAAVTQMETWNVSIESAPNVSQDLRQSQPFDVRNLGPAPWPYRGQDDILALCSDAHIH
jgi:hypothetical protein